MPEDFYPTPPSFGALMKRQGSERNFAEEIKSLNSYDELIKRNGDFKNPDDFPIIKKLLHSKGLKTFQQLRQQLTFREFADYIIEESIIDKVAVEESISQNISLYLATTPGEYFFNREYGCIIHNYDFRQLNDTPSKEHLKRTVEDYLEKFEKRIKVNTIKIDINDVQEVQEGGNPRICRYIIITISSTLQQTQDKLKDMKFRLIRYS